MHLSPHPRVLHVSAHLILLVLITPKHLLKLIRYEIPHCADGYSFIGSIVVALSDFEA
jgi:hypothetical protein